MTFSSPDRLLGLLLLPVVVAAYVASRRWSSQRTSALAAQGLVPTAMAARRSWRRHAPFALFLAALALLVVAFARPMATIKTPRREATMVLALDVSNSMDAGDVKPSRIGAAKAAADTLVRQLPGGVRIGVVAFGPTALIVQPPTFDHTAVIQAVNRLSVGGGTSVAAGILTSLDAIAGKTLIISKASLSHDNSGEVDIGYYGGATIVLLSDGEDTSQTDPTTMARLASVAGVRVDTIGVGTQAGTTVEIDGFRVATALDQQTLEAVAAVTNGTYHQVDDQAGLRSISSAVSLHFAVVAEHTEVTAIFAAAAVLLLVAGAAISLMWFGRVV